MQIEPYLVDSCSADKFFIAESSIKLFVVFLIAAKSLVRSRILIGKIIIYNWIIQIKNYVLNDV